MTGFLKRNILDLTSNELGDFLRQAGEPAYRAGQIMEWLYRKSARSFDEMKNLPAGLRDGLRAVFDVVDFDVVRKAISTDGTTKFLLRFKDGQMIETALIPAARRMTVCVSTQVGCKFACAFCASGQNGWQRDLTVAEIISQILLGRKHAQERHRQLTHVVFMGIGEPLDNYERVLRSIRTINAPQGLGLAARRITISTCGLVPQIRRLAREGLQVELSISLHGYDDVSRRRLIPVSRRYPLHDLLSACRDYIRDTNRQITFEYILIKDMTCSRHAADALGAMLSGLLCKLNLIPFNPTAAPEFRPPTTREVQDFRQRLRRCGVHSTVRRPRGADIAAACGQLRRVSSS